MVKSKKLSRGSLAVLLLALLLAVSMVVGITGAWFTDRANGDANTSIDLGAVRVAYTSSSAGAWTGGSPSAAVTGPIVPGDRYDFGGTVNFSGSDVDIYVRVKLQAKVYTTRTGAGTAQSPYEYSGDVTSALASYIVPNVTFDVSASEATSISAPTGENPAWTAQTGEAFYSMTAAQAAANNNMALTGYITIAANTPNKVGEVQLNGGNLYVELSYSISVIQFRNVTEANAVALLRAVDANNVVYDSTYSSLAV